MTRLIAPLAALTLLAAPQGAAAAFVMTVGGTFSGSRTSSDRFDGTDFYTNDLPPLVDVGRLAGGSFTAEYRFPDTVVPTLVPGANTVFYSGPGYGLSYTLFDAAGAVVMQSAFLTRFAQITVQNDRPVLLFVPPSGFVPAGFVDSVNLSAWGTAGPELTLPADLYGPTTIGPIQAELSFRDESRDPAVRPGTLTGLGIPTDPAVYRQFPQGGGFSLRWAYADGDTFDNEGPYREASTTVGYRITSVSVTPVPVPPTLVLAGLGVVAAGVGRRRLRPAAAAGGLTALTP